MTRTELLNRAVAINKARANLPDVITLTKAAEGIADQDSTAAYVAWSLVAGAQAAHRYMMDEASKLLAEAEELRDPIGVD